MKPETEKGLRAASRETQIEIVKLLSEILTADSFVQGLTRGDDHETLTADGEAIFEGLSEQFGDDDPTLDESQLVRLHEAICENRKEDAIDVLREVSGEYLRTVPEQKHLFPGRYEPDAL